LSGIDRSGSSEDDDWKTEESPKALPDDHHRNPILFRRTLFA
jgi:hypothetical protein